MALWLLKAGTREAKAGNQVVLSKNRRCRSFARKNDAPELERYGCPAVRIPRFSDDKSCCKFVPLTFPSKRSMSGKSFTRNPAGNDRDAAEWITEVIKDIDPNVEIDPITMARHLAAAEARGDDSSSGSGVRKNSLVSGSRQPLTYFFPPSAAPGGVPSFLVALGAVVVLVILATAVYLFRIREKTEENVANYESSSDEEGKLDLLSIVDDDEKGPGDDLSSLKQTSLQAGLSRDTQQDIRSRYYDLAAEQEGLKQDEDIRRILQDVDQKTQSNQQEMAQVPPQFVYAAAVATLATSDEFQQAFRKHEAVKTQPSYRQVQIETFQGKRTEDVNLEDITLEELMLQEQNIAKMDRDFEGSPSSTPEQQQDAEESLAGSREVNENNVSINSREQPTGELQADRASESETTEPYERPKISLEYLELEKPGKAGAQLKPSHNLPAPFSRDSTEEPLKGREYLELQKPGEQNGVQQVSRDSTEELLRNPEYLELQNPSKEDGVQQELGELPHDLTAPFSSIEEVSTSDEDLSQQLQKNQEALLKQREAQRKLELLALAAFVFVFSGIPSTELDPAEDADPELRRKIVQAAIPAVAVGAGALSVVTGVEGAFEMIGFTATASFIYYELLWGQSRRDLWQDVRNVKDHRQLVEFLKQKNIVG